ncbi:MAG TPA: 6-phosphogluconolactonase [Nitrospiraceae bacterium]|nr:6-phosphogluconolactonase [Nitrospiraceae bacterium]
MGATPEVHIFQDLRELAIDAADLFTWLGGQAISKTGRFHVALSGGSTPETLYTTLVRDYGARVDWAKVQFFFGDERCVPPSHPESNFGRANASLFLPLQIPPAHIHHMMRGEEDPETAAREYAKTLATVLNVSHDQFPRFDLILLGLGQDGHTASLFPGTRAVNEGVQWVVPGTAPSGIHARLTLTLNVINHAAVILFLVAGRDKAGITRAVLEPAPADTSRYPASFVRPEQGRVLWFIDEAASAELAVSKQKISSREE